MKQKITSNTVDNVQQLAQKATKNISLLAVLVLMFFFTHVSYIIFEIITLDLAIVAKNLTFSSSIDVAQRYAFLNVQQYLGGFLAIYVESFARSMTFYAYILFNGEFRQKFVEAILCIKSLLK